MVRAAIALAIVCASAVVQAQPAKFQLAVNPRRTSTNGFITATVTLEVRGVSGADRYWAPRFKGFRVVDEQFIPSTSVRAHPSRGQELITSEIRRYTLKPLRPGSFYFDPARVRLKGVISETKGAYVVVTGAAAHGSSVGELPTGAPTGLDVPGYRLPKPVPAGDMFIDVVADKSSAKIGEQVTVTWLLYTRAEVLKFEPRLPRWRSLWTEVIEEPADYLQYHDVSLKGRAYQVAIVSKRAVFPTRPGTVVIRPYKAKVVSLGGDVGRPVALASPRLSLSVGRLPKPKPPGFDGTYFGTYTAKATVDRAEVDAGQPVTVELVVSGVGPVRRTTQPVVGSEHFDVVPSATFDEEVTRDGNTVGGTRKYTYLVTPKRGGGQVFPPVEIHYFDPASGTYAVAATYPIPLLVRGDPGLTKHAAKRALDGVPKRDIRVIASGHAAPSRKLVRPYERLWWILLVIFPPLVFVGVVVVDGVRQRLRKETPRSRRRRAKGRANKRYRTAEIHIRGNRPQQFYGELARCIVEHLDDRFEGQGVASMTRSDLRELLAGAGFTRGLVETIERELDSCDTARFAATDATAEEMRKALDRVQTLMVRLERTSVQEEV